MSSKITSPPFLTAEQLRQFQSEFTLFDTELDLRKLKDTFSLANAGIENYKPVEYFVSSILTKREKCNFSEYIQMMIQFFEKQDEGELIMDILSENKKDLPQEQIKEIIEESMDRDLTEKETSDIMTKIFELGPRDDSVPKRKIIDLLSCCKNRSTQ